MLSFCLFYIKITSYKKRDHLPAIIIKPLLERTSSLNRIIKSTMCQLINRELLGRSNLSTTIFISLPIFKSSWFLSWGIYLKGVKDLNDAKFCKEPKTIIVVDKWFNSFSIILQKSYTKICTLIITESYCKSLSEIISRICDS